MLCLEFGQVVMYIIKLHHFVSRLVRLILRYAVLSQISNKSPGTESAYPVQSCGVLMPGSKNVAFHLGSKKQVLHSTVLHSYHGPICFLPVV